MRDAVTRGSCCRRDPAAAFLGFANTGSPRSSLSSFRRTKSGLRMYTSPRTVRNSGAPSGRTRGMDRIVLRFAVTFSPRSPSPRVAPTERRPSRYVSEMASPSIFGSATYSTLGKPVARRTRASNARSNSSLNTLSSDSIGISCTTGSNEAATSPPTLRDGELGSASSGCASSSAASSRMSASYSTSVISGSSST